MRAPVAVVLFLSALPALAQQSAHFQVHDGVFNGGGRPANGTVATSSSFRVRFDAIGEGVVGTGPSAGHFAVDSGFVGQYRPPGEVEHLRFVNRLNLQWDPEPSGVGDYDVYRGQVGSFSGGFGTCLLNGLSGTDATDLTSPPLSQAWFYLVAAHSRLGEAGPLGINGKTGQHRQPAAACP